MMMLLAIDTSTRMIGIGLHDGKQVLSEYIWQGRGRHTIELGPQIALMMRRVEVKMDDLEGVGVALGPGSYTGLRIGLAMGKGLALACGLKLIGVPTFDVIALRQPQDSKPLFVALEAGRGRIVGMWYKWSRKSWRPQSEMLLTSWEKFVKDVVGPCRVSGEIDPHGRQLLSEQEGLSMGSPASCLRRPSDLAEIALERMRSKRRVKPQPANPIYSAAP
jgi:tRNA threonylcarbamoyladenosine biosynthesis protein TsaB